MPSHLAQARALARIPAHRKVASLLEGEYVALHPGRSTEFTDLRAYVRGDDPKDLDWKASARARTLLVRRYHALRKLTLLLVVGTGRSMTALSTPGVAKHEVASGIAGVLAHLAVRHGDLVGLVHGDAENQELFPARGGVAHVERCLAAVATPRATPSDLAAVLRRVARSVRRRALVVVVTDATEADADVISALRRLRVQHEVLVAVVEGLDPLELDARSSLLVLDIDSGAAVPSWLRDDELLRREHAQVVTREREVLDAALDRLGLAHVRVWDLEGVLPAVRTLLERHRRGARR